MKSKRLNISFMFLLTFWLVNESLAQQLPQFSQYSNNHFLVNNAAVGWDGDLRLTIGGRTQWTGFDNAPKSAFLAFSGSKSRLTNAAYNPSLRISRNLEQQSVNKRALRHGYGALVHVDQFGSFRKMSFNGSYAIHLPISKTFTISVGPKLGVTNHTFIQDRGIPLTPEEDMTYQNYISTALNKFQLNLGAGIYFYSEQLFLGIAADDISKDFISFGTGDVNFNTQTHTTIIGGYNFKATEKFVISPSVLVKLMKPAPSSIEASLRFEYNKFLWGGFSYRHTDAFVGMLGCELNKRFRIGYSFDFSLSEFRTVSNGSHELILGIKLNSKKK